MASRGLNRLVGAGLRARPHRASVPDCHRELPAPPDGGGRGDLQRQSGAGTSKGADCHGRNAHCVPPSQWQFLGWMGAGTTAPLRV